VFDVHEPINPVQIAAFPTPADQDYCKKGAKFGRIFGARGFDIADPFAPSENAVLATVTTGLVLILREALGFALYPMAIVLAAAALAPITEVTQTAPKLGELRAGADRVATIFHQEAQVPDRGTASPAIVTEPLVRFEGVTFGYSRGRKPVLDGF
jgi:ATP-binding cassette, subfamily C, bacterial CydC